MKSGLVFFFAVLQTVLFTACSEQGKAKIIDPETPHDSVTGRVIRISANDAMRYDVTSFFVKPGEQITVIFLNAGRLPKATMGHNWVLLKAETNLRDFAGAGAMYAKSDYIDPEMRDQVLASTALLGPGETSSVHFTTPAKTGVYPYVCTFPGHLAAGMQGTMTVQP